MKYVYQNNIQRNNHRDVYWKRYIIESEKDSQKMTTILVCGSFEFFAEKFNKNILEDKEINDWLDNFILNKEELKEEKVFLKKIHYYSLATNIEGSQSILDFLEKEI